MCRLLLLPPMSVFAAARLSDNWNKAMLRHFVKWNRDGAAWLERMFPRTFQAPCYKQELEKRIAQDIACLHPSTICEVGGINRPLLVRSPDYHYIGVDIDEHPTCHQIYDRFIVQSIEQPLDLQADMIISLTLLEHVPDNRSAVNTMFNALREGGTTHHYIPSRFHPYSIALRLIGPNLQKRLIAVLRPAAADVTGYPTFFDRCSPEAMTRLFRTAGFVDVDVKAFYRASDYFAFFLPTYLVVALFENLCSELDWRALASGFLISARRSKAPRVSNGGDRR